MRAIVVEDSRLARKELVDMIGKLDRFDQILEAASGKEAVQMIQEHDPDVLFLDIHLPGMNGFEVLEALDDVPAVIFTTAFDQYAIKSFEYNAIDYLMKPISKDRLSRAVDKLQIAPEKDIPGSQHRPKQIFVKDGDRCWFVKIEKIRIFESVGNYTRIYFDKEKPLVLKSLQYLEGILDNEVFFRASRQQIVNITFVDGVSNSFNGKLKLKLSTGEEVEVSRRQSTEFKSRFSL